MRNKVTIIGAGKMGIGITQFFAQNNYHIKLIDLNEEVIKNAKEKIEEELLYLQKQRLLEEDIKLILNRISTSANLDDAKYSSIIFEAIPEKIELKVSLFSKLEEICDRNVVFATNTSGISINSIAEHMSYPDRLLGTHFFMPASVIPLVEVVKGNFTEEKIAESVINLLNNCGKKAVLIHKDIPGFIANRIQHAMAREAISLLEKGVASAEDIDTVVKWSLGIRLVSTGPLEQRDLNGIDIHTDIASYLYKDLENRTTPSQLLIDKIHEKELGTKTNKGFYEWDQNTKKEIIRNKNETLLEIVKYLNNK